MIGGVVRFLSGSAFMSAGMNLAKVTKVAEEAKAEAAKTKPDTGRFDPGAMPKFPTEAERTAQRLAATLGITGASAKPKPSVPPEVVQGLVAFGINLLVGIALNRAANVIGRR